MGQGRGHGERVTRPHSDSFPPMATGDRVDGGAWGTCG